MIMMILPRHIHDRYEKLADNNVVSSNRNTKIIILILRVILLFNGSLTSRLYDPCRGNGIKELSGRGYPICSRQTLTDEIGKENVPLYVAVIAGDNELHMVSHRSL